MVLIDSSVWVEAMRRHGAAEIKIALECLLEEYEAALCGPVRLEVLGGAKKETRSRLVGNFRDIPYISAVDEIWDESVALSWRMRDLGYAIPWNDLVIASIALGAGCRIYAVDQHFDWISQETGMRMYTPGYGGAFVPDGVARRAAL